MIKILQINIVVKYGSTGHIAEEIGQTALLKGWESYIAYGRNPRASKSTLIRIGTDFDVKMHGLYTLLFDGHGLASKNATKDFIKQIQEIKPDIIHLHNIHGYYINYEILFDYLKSANIPVVWTLHDCWAMTGHCAYFEFAGCDKWKTQCYECPLRATYPASLFFDRSKVHYLQKKELFNSVAKMILVPVSEWLANIVRQSYLSKYPVRVINNGINPEVFYPRHIEELALKNELSNRFVILGVAHIWSERKGLNDFIKLSKVIASDCSIVLIGLSDKQRKNLPSNIIGLSATENVNQLAEFYSLANVFINPTWEDNFPTTNIEALACGTPVITYKTGGSVEAVDEDTGFVVEQGDIHGLLTAIDCIKRKDKSEYIDICRSRAISKFNKNDRYLDYINLYDQLINNDKQ